MTEAARIVLQTPLRRGRTFFGQPRALAYLAFTEAWERFSYYGMTALLVLYMSQSLLLPGHVDHIAGFGAFHAALQTVFGPMSTLALASQIYGLYTGFVYFTPVFGGLIADRLIGRRRAVLTGVILMSAGQIAMAFDASFLLALLLLIVGCGFLKGNISTQVGGLYDETDAAGITRGFAIFSTAINIGAVAGPLLCGLLAELYGWHAGFALAGFLMLIGLATYLAGYRHLPDSARAARRASKSDPLHAVQWRTIAALLVVMVISIFQSIAYYQYSDMGLVWISDHVDLNLFGLVVPVAWFNSINSFVSIVSVPALFALWRYQARHGGEPCELTKIATGALMTAAANFVLVAGAAIFSRVPVILPVLYNVLLGVGFLYYWPTMLALVSRAAPPRLKATLMGCVFLTLFVSNLTIGQIGALYERMSPANFWLLNAAIAAMGGVIALLSRHSLGKVIAAGVAEHARGPASEHG